MACSCGCGKCREADKKANTKIRHKSKSRGKPSGLWLNKLVHQIH